MGLLSVIPLPYRILGISLILVALVAGSVAYGYNKAENKYIAKIAKMEADSDVIKAKLDAALADVKTVVVTEYVDKIKVIKEKEYVYRDKIVTVPSKCELSSGWVYLHDSVATGSDADTTRTTDDTSSGIKDTEALGVITENYGICKQNAEQLNSLQKWIRDSQAAVEKSNEEARKRSKK